ncbi:MAG: hypothetical protein AUJ51_00435 [Elusimicrobia bacterium CG1_02_56_21]|nr:MAG: hypothetical protein AUJ51_00435 [Elusimicrobia bacterium CG1_02_56_21]
MLATVLIKSGKNRKILKASHGNLACNPTAASPEVTTAVSPKVAPVVSLIRSRGRIPSHPSPNHPSPSLSRLRR